MAGLTVLKLGGSVITEKDKPFTFNRDNVSRLAAEIAGSLPHCAPLVVIHGGGSFGHYLVAKTGIDRGVNTPKRKVAFAQVQSWQSLLNFVITRSLQAVGVPAIPCQPSASAVMRSGRLARMDLAAIEGLLKLGMVPVLYGVPAYDEERGCSILSGDELTVYLAKGLGATRVIHGADVDGVYTDDPKANPKAELIKVIDRSNVDAVLAALARSSKPDATGGILNKVSKLVELAKAGVECEIVNAAKPGIVARSLKGERGLGTLIKL